MALMQLIYVSTAREEYGDDVLEKILASAVANNLRQQITGMLLYADGGFLQVLEGEAAAVEETFARIVCDPRHHSIFEITREPIADRNFQQWTMGFHRVRRAELEANPAYAPLIAGRINLAALGVRPGLALDILKDFAARY